MHHRPSRCDSEHLNTLIARLLIERPCGAVEDIERDGLWEYVAAHAWQSRIGGILIHHLRCHRIDLPNSAASQLDAYREHVRAANAYRLARVEPVLARLQSEGVPFLVLKGAALNAVLYRDPGMRPMVDVDIMIHPHDAMRVDRLMADVGCTPGADLVRHDFYPRYHYEREYFTPHQPPVKTDLHVRPFRPLRYSRTVPDDALWGSPRTVQLGNLRVAIPGAEDMLVHLAVHAACHGLRELRWLYDVKCWLDRFGPHMDWNRVAEQCRRCKLDLPVRRALQAVSLTFGAANPMVARALEAVTCRAGLLDRLALRQAPYGEKRPVADVLTNFLCTPGLRFRLGYLGAVLLPGTSHMGQLYRWRHPGWLLVAHAVRTARGLTRPLLPATPQNT
ncbi:MAG: nucleotidyltransferase family protein [Phycisphaerae bacterium]|nr:nucleotidyltransferase family protein [Phycisphaerae bacterium]